MKAVVIERYGAPEVLKVQEVPEPELRPHDVLVGVRASSVNPVDTKIRAGSQRAVVRHPLPWILGLDVAGEVLAKGSAVSKFSVGDAVYGSPTHTRRGCYAEQVAIDERQLARKPQSLSFVEAASLPLVTLTALRCLEPRLRTQPGQCVHIQAGAGGVGTVAIQLARIFGAEVSTTCSAKNADLVRELGATQVIDYRHQAFDDAVADCDLVLESVGGEHWNRALRASRRGGEVASINAGLGMRGKRYGAYWGAALSGFALAWFVVRGALQGVRVRNVVRAPDGEALERVTDWVERGLLRPVVGAVFGLEDLAAAHEALERGGIRGKVAIAVNEG